MRGGVQGRHVRGAKVTVYTNSADDVTYTTGGDLTNLPPKMLPEDPGRPGREERALHLARNGDCGRPSPHTADIS